MIWGQKGKVAVLLDGQFGSTGKGQIAAWLSLNACPHGVDIATTNAGAQAGHTTRYEGKEFICYHLPTVAVMQGRYREAGHPFTRAYVNAGSIIDPEALAKELHDTGFYLSSLHIHPRAAVITQAHKEAERARGSSTEGLASTQKGVGAALADKIMRRATLAGDTPSLALNCSMFDLNEFLRRGCTITAEVPQGFGLGINHGWDYPACTSRDCYVNSALNDAGIHPSFLGNTCMVVRTMPIRVGAIYNEMGEKVGDSGPFPPDSRELDWARDLPGVEPERTTVTKRVRRIATWSDLLYRRACSLNRPDIVALTFCDYLNVPEELEELVERMIAVEAELGLHSVQKLFSWGNRVEDVGGLEAALTYLRRRGPMR